jgi:hypothetical protein
MGDFHFFKPREHISSVLTGWVAENNTPKFFCNVWKGFLVRRLPGI